MEETAVDSSRVVNKWWILVIVALLLTIVATVLGVVLTDDDDYPIATVEEFKSGLPTYSLQLIESSSSSPQAKAFEWLKSDNRYPLYRLNQRYALAVLYFTTNGTSWVNSTGWLSSANECTWYMRASSDICNNAFRLSTLSLYNNGLDGSLPAELELLTKLYYMSLNGDLSGTIHSEL
jgi:hypothetical protein